MQPNEEGVVAPPTCNLQNIVATFSLGTIVDLPKIALVARNAEYNPKRFAALIMRIREPKTTALIFANGKVVVTGAKCKANSRVACRKFARVVQKIGYNAKFMDFKIRNVVASVDMHFPVNVAAMSLDGEHGKYASYEPEIFPGLVYRMPMPPVAVLVFTTGKIVITGAKCEADVFAAKDNIVPVVTAFAAPVIAKKKKSKRSKEPIKGSHQADATQEVVVRCGSA
jgi:transcription initiation factor TFIID TATA-box-binding protein